MTLEYSVIIPTFNRIDVLRETLLALEQQCGAPNFEVIVVNDGSDDGTKEYLSVYKTHRPFVVLTQKNRGPAVARNAGVSVARGQWVAFLGDDTVPDLDWLSHHVRKRSEYGCPHEVAVVGYTKWHSRMEVTPFLHYLNEGGLQFGYGLIKDPENLPFAFFYTSNISLSRHYLTQDKFNEKFPYPAFEDIELGYRLTRRGLKLVYEPKAIVAHDHPTTYERFSKRQQKAGYCGVLLYQLHPQLKEFVGLSDNGAPPSLPSYIGQKWREFIICHRKGNSFKAERLWRKALKYHYILGLQRGWRELVKNKSSAIS